MIVLKCIEKKILYKTALSCFYLIILLNTSYVWSFQWPVKEPHIIFGFGQLYEASNSFYTGILIETPQNEVRPLGDGKVLYIGETTSLELGGIGKYIVIEHDRGIRAIYGNLEPADIIPTRREVGPNDIIGTLDFYTKNNESNSARILFLKLIDGELEEIINPLVALPELDTYPLLRIESLAVGNTGPGENLKTVTSNTVLTTEQLPWFIKFVTTNDTDNEGAAVFFPKSITLKTNETILHTITFTSIKIIEQELLLGGHSLDELFPFSALFDDYIYAGSFSLPPGEQEVTVVVETLSGRDDLLKKINILVEE